MVGSHGGESFGQFLAMAGLPQVRGMLLEEVILKFLEANGYTTVANAGTDPTLRDGPAGLQVLGRGTKHQVDAIADYHLKSRRYVGTKRASA